MSRQEVLTPADERVKGRRGDPPQKNKWSGQVKSTFGKVASVSFDFGSGRGRGGEYSGAPLLKRPRGTSPAAPPAPDCADIYQNIVSLY